MARPRRDGVDYFSFDTDFFSDEKIIMLMARYGADGLAVYIYLLTRVYRDKGYYLEWRGEDSDYLTARALNMSVDKVGQIKAYLLKQSLFDDKLFKSAEVLSSKGIQRRYQQAVKVRAVKNPVVVRGDLWLLDEDETESFIKVRHDVGFSENNPSFSGNNSSNSENYPTKQSKVKQSKVKHSKAEKTAGGGEPACSAAQREFEKIKRPTQTEAERISELCDQHGEQAVVSAIRKAIDRGGKSLAYVERILEDVVRQPQQSGRHQPTYDADDIESMMYDEWFGSEE